MEPAGRVGCRAAGCERWLLGVGTEQVWWAGARPGNRDSNEAGAQMLETDGVAYVVCVAGVPGGAT